MTRALKRKQMILLGTAVVLLVATVVLLMRVFRPGSSPLGFGLGDPSAVSTSANLFRLPLEIFRDPRFVLLEGESSAAESVQLEGRRVDTAAPSEPLNVQGHDMKISGKVFIKWQAPEGFGEATFVVYRSDIPSVLGEAVGEIQGEGFTDSGLTDGTPYYYTVHTRTDEGESDNITQISVTPTDTAPPAPPSDVVITANTEGEGTVLAWTNPRDADFASVNIYRSDTAGEIGELISTNVTEEVYVDETALPNTTYFYTLTAVDVNANESDTRILPLTGRDNPFLPL